MFPSWFLRGKKKRQVRFSWILMRSQVPWLERLSAQAECTPDIPGTRPYQRLDLTPRVSSSRRNQQRHSLSSGNAKSWCNEINIFNNKKEKRKRSPCSGQ